MVLTVSMCVDTVLRPNSASIQTEAVLMAALKGTEKKYAQRVGVLYFECYMISKPSHLSFINCLYIYQNGHF